MQIQVWWKGRRCRELALTDMSQDVEARTARKTAKGASFALAAELPEASPEHDARRKRETIVKMAAVGPNQQRNSGTMCAFSQSEQKYRIRENFGQVALGPVNVQHKSTINRFLTKM